MQNARTHQNDYIRKVLAAYRQTPGTTGHVRRSDRLLAAQLYQRRIPLEVVQNALVLAASRRLYRNPDALPLGLVRSLHYFTPAIQEVLGLKNVPASYFHYLRHKLETFEETNQAFSSSPATPDP